jgi:hypothetical protein
MEAEEKDARERNVDTSMHKGLQYDVFRITHNIKAYNYGYPCK